VHVGIAEPTRSPSRLSHSGAKCWDPIYNSLQQNTNRPIPENLSGLAGINER
jgi:hypothetical protein